MLKKLIKYEMFSSARVFLPLYAALLILALANTILGKLSNNAFFENQAIANFIIFFAFYAVTFAIFAVTFVVIIRRFSKSLLGKEGYLMFTLPVSVSSHILSKFICAFLWCMASGVVVLLASSLILFSQIQLRDAIMEVMFSVHDFFMFSPLLANLNRGFLLFQLVLFGILSAASGILLVYASISVGHLVKKHKTLASIVVFIGITTIVNNPLQIFITYNVSAANTPWIILVYCVFYLALSAGSFALTRWILKNKLNLE